jgi:putative NADPH-quinone reductase
VKQHVLVIDGHPDPEPARLCHALADAYAEGARQAGLNAGVIRLSGIDIQFLRSREEFENQEPEAPIRSAQQAIEAASHLVLVYPLWLGTMPALMKAFLEQTFRPAFAAGDSDRGMMWPRRLKGRSARVVVTMGMPAFFYRWYFRAHSLKSLERNILKFCGIKPVRETLLGLVETASEEKRRRWLQNMRDLGARAR